MGTAGGQDLASSGPESLPPRWIAVCGLLPADVALAVFALFLLFMTAVRAAALYRPGLQAALLAGVVAAVFLLGRWRVRTGRKYRSGEALDLLVPAAAIPLLFTCTGNIVSVFSDFDGDTFLRRLDLALLGGHPSIWLQRIHHPLATEVLQWVYSSFYFIPLLIAAALFRQRRRPESDYFVFLTCFGFCLSYLGYFLVPAVSPQFGLHGAYAFPLQGVWLFPDIVACQTSLEAIHRDCFPSGHTMMTVVFLHFAAAHTKKLFLFLLPLGTALVFSTLYLRYHYGVDLLAGTVFFLFVAWSAPVVYRALGGGDFRSRRPVRESAEE